MKKFYFDITEMMSKPIDILLISLLSVILLWQPYYLYQQVNLFEWGLYLPGIDAVAQGQIPYRDFFHMRGPFELYVPAFFMSVFGFRADVLGTYFYLGSVLTILVILWIAYELIKQRALLYCFVLVLIARTFPRVVFTFWGGMRYAWGALAIWGLVKAFKTRRRRWFLASGVFMGISFLTSIEIGIGVFFAFLALNVVVKEIRKSAGLFLAGFLVIILPYFIYLLTQNALGPYLQAQIVVVTKNPNTFLQIEPTPNTPTKFVHALFVPSDMNFRQMTPFYCYIAFVCFYFWRWINKKVTVLDQALVAVAAYGIILYTTGFRSLWASVFEMSLQPEKIILFYLLAQLVSEIKYKFNKFKWVATIVLVAIVLSSVVYSTGRFNKRFFTVAWLGKKIAGKDTAKLVPLSEQSTQLLDLPRIKHMVVPSWQAEDLKQLKSFIDKHTKPHERVWMYPELASLHFILNRPWVGRFPMGTSPWLDEGWFIEYEKDLQAAPPEYAIVNKVIPSYFEKNYFPIKASKVKYERMMNFLQSHYVVEESTPTYFIYRRH